MACWLKNSAANKVRFIQGRVSRFKGILPFSKIKDSLKFSLAYVNLSDIRSKLLQMLYAIGNSSGFIFFGLLLNGQAKFLAYKITFHHSSRPMLRLIHMLRCASKKSSMAKRPKPPCSVGK